MSIHVTDFKWEKGKNDLEYISLLEKNLDVMMDNLRKCSKVAREQHKKGRATERKNIIEEVDMHLREAGYTYDSNMGIGDNIGSALLKEYANGYKKGEQDGRADERAKVFEEIAEAFDRHLFDSPMMNPIMTRNEILLFLEQLKEQK